MGKELQAKGNKIIRGYASSIEEMPLTQFSPIAIPAR